MIAPSQHNGIANVGHLTDAELLAVARQAMHYDMLFANAVPPDRYVAGHEQGNTPEWRQHLRRVENAILGLLKTGWELKRKETA